MGSSNSKDLGRDGNVSKAALPRRAGPWRVSVWAGGVGGAGGPEGGKVWMLLSLAGARAEATSGEPPCVYVVAENDSPEDAEAMDVMPRFKLASADGAYLSGPPRESPDPDEGGPGYSGGRAFTTRDGGDGRDNLEAYPAPSTDEASAWHEGFRCYIWSPSRESALRLGRGGALEWDSGASRRTVTNYGSSSSLTVWTITAPSSGG